MQRGTATTRTAIREVGFAAAIFAVWLLSLLAPMHQASGLLRELSDRGIITVAEWSICNPSGDVATADGKVIAVCPLSGIGKTDLLLPAGFTPPLFYWHQSLSQILATDAQMLARTGLPGDPWPRGPPAFSI